METSINLWLFPSSFNPKEGLFIVFYKMFKTAVRLVAFLVPSIVMAQAPHASIEILSKKAPGTVASLIENPYIPGTPSLGPTKHVTAIADSNGHFKFSFEPNPYWWYRVDIAGNAIMYGAFASGDSIVVSPAGWNMRVLFDKIGAYTEENQYYTYYGGKLFARSLTDNLNCDVIKRYSDTIQALNVSINADFDRIRRAYPEHVYFVRDLKRWSGLFNTYAQSLLSKKAEKNGIQCGYDKHWLDTIRPDFTRDQLNPYDLAEIVGNIIEAKFLRLKRTDSASIINEPEIRRQFASEFSGVARDLGFLYVPAMSPSAQPKNILTVLWEMLDTMYAHKGDPLARQCIEKYIASISDHAPGAKAYNFMLPDSIYRIKSLSDFRGKTVIAHFWGTWCGPCLAELDREAEFERLHASDTNLVFVNIALEDHRFEKWKKFLSEHQMKGYQLYAEGLWESDVAQKFGINIVPLRLVINGEGKIVDSFLGIKYEPKDIEKSIETAQK